MRSRRPLRVGLCGIGLDAYWPQFAGLRERLEGYVTRVEARFVRPGVEVVNLGLVDSPERSHEAGHQCRREDIDVLFLYVTTYALSNTVLPLVQRAGVPVVVLNLQPEAAIDYKVFNRLEDRTAMTGHWLCKATSTTTQYPGIWTASACSGNGCLACGGTFCAVAVKSVG